MFDSVMLAWLLELGAAIAVAGVGVVLWSLPPNTPVVGRPPLWVGWILVALGLVIAVVSSVGRIGLEFQLPLRRRTTGYGRVAQAGVPTPLHQTLKLTPPPARTPTPIPAPLPRVFTDATAQDLVALANKESLTRAQVDKLLEPHKGKWLSISAEVRDVGPPRETFVMVFLRSVNGQDGLRGSATFRSDKERASALHVGAHVKVRGIVGEVEKDSVNLDNCEFE